MELRPYQEEAKQAILNEWDKGHKKTLLVLPTGCHAKGEQLLMANGRSKAVENIHVGDHLLGADGMVRNVLFTTGGIGDLYRVVSAKGDPFVVTGNHKLTLTKEEDCQSPDKWIDVPVEEYLTKRFADLKEYQLVRAKGIEKFPDAKRPELRLKPETVIPCIFEHPEFIADIFSLPVKEAQYIPKVYKTAEASVRASMLSEILDRYGVIRNGGYDFIHPSETLLRDVAFLGRSLGLTVYNYDFLDEKTPSVWIQYDPQILSCKETADKPTFAYHPCSTFYIESVGRGEYFGFTVDGDNRYLLPDFTVTHNCGKTITFASVIENQVDKGHRVLILAHRKELLDQAANKLKAVSGIDSGLEKAESTSLNSLFPVTVGSVQTMAQKSRLVKFPSDYYQDIVVDEAHHCMSKSYKRVLEHFPNANVLGVTATPERGDKQNLGTYFDSEAYAYPLTRAIEEKYLCPIKTQLIPLKLNISNVKISQGDFSAGDIGYALDPYLEAIADKMKTYCAGRKTVVFLPLIATSQKFCEMLNDRGLKAAEVNGTSTDREEILTDFEAGKYDVLCNSMLLTEGWDCPSVDCIVILRPTKLRSLYQQMVGRGMRLSPGKTELLLLDFLWMTKRHDLCKPSSLVCDDEAVAKIIDKRMQTDKGGFDLLDAKGDAIAQREAALAREIALAKERAEAEKREKEEKERKRQEYEETMRQARLNAEEHRKMMREKAIERRRETERNQVITGIDMSKLMDARLFICIIGAEAAFASYEPKAAWEKRSPTKRQLECLARNGINGFDLRCAGDVGFVIDQLSQRSHMGLSTPKQIRYLQSKGFRNVARWKLQEASLMIDHIAINHWTVPTGINPASYFPHR